ncbi:MAG TPA: hypothetical protein VK155_00755 [Bacteroidales bacterium]|nr:hypothetical protein [Bacteroidales bacterium]
MLNPKKFISPKSDTHVWNFSRVGGVNRVNLETGMDLVCLENLDQKLWTALSCPVYGLEIDYKTLELIDGDKDNRIRVPEIIQAVKWATSLIKNPDDLARENRDLPLSAINDNTDEGKILVKSAKQILSNLGKPQSEEISVEETSDTVKIFSNTKFNGDGIITEHSTDAIKIKITINDIISCMGSATDLSGKEGINLDHVNGFFDNCRDYSDWHAKAEVDSKKILPFGGSTGEALAAFNSIKGKVEDYFLRCHLSEFNPDSSDILNSLDSRYEEIRCRDLSGCINEIASFPLARIDANPKLHLRNGSNPAWKEALTRFDKLVMSRLFPGKEYLEESDMEVIDKTFDDYRQWLSEKKGTCIEKLGLVRVREILFEGSEEILYDLIEQDKALEVNTNNIFLVDKLVRYYRDLYKLLKNYVTFYDFYSPDDEAIFQAGKLYIDQRCCDLCLKVTDMSKHNSLARTSGLCLIYCDCFSAGQKMTIVAALTDGDIYNIEVGRNAIFYDRKGNHWDATIIRIIDNPISIRQAFWSPYIKVSKFISSQIEKVAAAKDKEVESAATSGIENASGKIESGMKDSMSSTHKFPAPVKSAAPAQPFDIGKFVGIFAAISLAFGAIGSVITSVLTGFLSLSWWKMPLALLGVLLAISGPSMIIAWLKLRKRNLAPLLDANGWAINARSVINITFGNTLTHLARLPENSKVNMLDPFSKKRKPWLLILIVIILTCIAGYLLFHYGFLSNGE